MNKNFTHSLIFYLIFTAGWFSVPSKLYAQNTCASAAVLNSSTVCVNTGGTVIGSTYGSDLPTTCGLPRYDVWYRFVAQTANPTITLSGIGANFTNPELQLLSGICGGFSNVACSVTSGTNQVISAVGLTVGATYYIRVFSSNTTGTAPTSAGGFSICVRDPLASTIETSRSYINVSKGATGGTVDYLDTLEIRSTLVVKSNFADSLSFRDTLYNLKGLRLVPGSITLRTNEGKVYKSFTDVFDGDAGHRFPTGLDTVIRINFGTGATATARGRLNNSSKPSVYGGSCIIMATYRVVVYAGYGRKINFKTGGITYRDGATGVMYNAIFPDDSLIVFQSPGLCPTSVSVTNAIGVEGNGSFGIPTTGAPLARNRTASTFTNYTYQLFTPTNGPNDYYYGVANNTSQTYTTVNTWGKPGAPYRVFGVWDIIGDHTGAANTARGNKPCDTTKAVSATNPCGYMLVVNSAYKTDTAFQYTVSNLCPGTHYELSAWFRNICYKCGCDSNGVGASGAGYIPLATGDSSGVQPNIAISVNGVDYYTTGNIPYYGAVPYFGTTPTASDTTNRWVKKGFIYVTGPSETSFTLTIRNNAPGGGGNDWALDDISVATCLPNMKYSPSNTPNICRYNSITIHDTVRSYYNTYNHYKWQRSTDGGTTWTDIVGANGVASPVWNGSSWQYITNYTIPPANTAPGNTGDKYRVVVGTTAANMLNTNCNFTDGIAIITLNVVDCGPILDLRLLSFSGTDQNNKAALRWSTSGETEPVLFAVEKSIDGTNYFTAGTIQGIGAPGIQQYTFTDTVLLTGNTLYRVSVQTANGPRLQSHTVLLQGEVDEFSVANVVNPFTAALPFDVTVAQTAKLDVTLTDTRGRPILKKIYTAKAGINSLLLQETENLSAGIYFLHVQYRHKLAVRKVVKQ
ncbi:MAG TPA: T9SS type A sorting domain-containing protein [Flavisolibacter sp.]|nr:T9SS type A sorting domain-containing protein [Flavisolibacter sp.]